MSKGVAFDREAFRTGVLTAMGVGLPETKVDRPTFHFAPVVSATSPTDVPMDAENVPFDPTAVPVSTTKDPVQVSCAYEYFDVAGQPVDFGIVTPSKVVLTLLDAQWQKIKDFSYVTIGGERYERRRVQPPIGMVTETVWIVHCEAEDES